MRKMLEINPSFQAFYAIQKMLLSGIVDYKQ